MIDHTESHEYLAAVSRALEKFSSRRQKSPAILLNEWTNFVESTIRGYPAGWYEFDNDRRVRDAIQAVLGDGEVRKYPEAHEWAKRIGEVDDQYRAVLTPIPDQSAAGTWWLAGVPRYGGRELAEDIARIFKLNIEAHG